MPAGRPSSYDPAYCDRVIELGKQGASVVEMACAIGVSRATLEANWPAAHPDFLEAFTRAKEESQVWWERKGRDSLETSGFQASVWSRSMAARFPADWRESKLLGSDPANPLPSPVSLDVSGFSEATLRELAGAGKKG